MISIGQRWPLYDSIGVLTPPILPVPRLHNLSQFPDFNIVTVPRATGHRMAVLDQTGPRSLHPTRFERLLGAPVGDQTAHRGHRRSGPGASVVARASASPTMFGRGRNILTISDFDHMKAAVALRHDHITAVRPATEPEVQIRSLSDYDAMFLRP